MYIYTGKSWRLYDTAQTDTRENLGNSMIPPKLTPKEKPQPLELLIDGDEHQGSDFLPKEYSIGATGNTMNHKSTMGLLTNLEVLLYQGG